MDLDSTPWTLHELLSDGTLSTLVPFQEQFGICSICKEFYADPDVEIPVQLRYCRHIFGSQCISKWIAEGQNSCPVCRSAIIQIWRQRLLDWYPGYAMNGPPTSFASYCESLYRKLCEAIVCWIEACAAPSDRDPEEEAEEWMMRQTFTAILALGSFRAFVEAWDTEMSLDCLLICALRARLPDQGILYLLLGCIDEVGDYDLLLGADENTWDRLAGWFRRIRASRDRLLESFVAM